MGSSVQSLLKVILLIAFVFALLLGTLCSSAPMESEPFHGSLSQPDRAKGELLSRQRRDASCIEKKCTVEMTCKPGCLPTRTLIILPSGKKIQIVVGCYKPKPTK